MQTPLTYISILILAISFGFGLFWQTDVFVNGGEDRFVNHLTQKNEEKQTAAFDDGLADSEKNEKTQTVDVDNGLADSEEKKGETHEEYVRRMLREAPSETERRMQAIAALALNKHIQDPAERRKIEEIVADVLKTSVEDAKINMGMSASDIGLQVKEDGLRNSDVEYRRDVSEEPSYWEKRNVEIITLSKCTKALLDVYKSTELATTKMCDERKQSTENWESIVKKYPDCANDVKYCCFQLGKGFKSFAVNVTASSKHIFESPDVATAQVLAWKYITTRDEHINLATNSIVDYWSDKIRTKDCLDGLTSEKIKFSDTLCTILIPAGKNDTFVEPAKKALHKCITILKNRKMKNDVIVKPNHLSFSRAIYTVEWADHVDHKTFKNLDELVVTVDTSKFGKEAHWDAYLQDGRKGILVEENIEPANEFVHEVRFHAIFGEIVLVTWDGSEHWDYDEDKWLYSCKEIHLLYRAQFEKRDGEWKCGSVDEDAFEEHFSRNSGDDVNKTETALKKWKGRLQLCCDQLVNEFDVIPILNKTHGIIDVLEDFVFHLHMDYIRVDIFMSEKHGFLINELEVETGFPLANPQILLQPLKAGWDRYKQRRTSMFISAQDALKVIEKNAKCDITYNADTSTIQYSDEELILLPDDE